MMTKQPLARACLMAGLFLGSANAVAQSSLLILDFEFVEEMHDPHTAESDQKRLGLVTEELKAKMQSCPAVRIADPAPAAAEIALARSRIAYIHRCNGCAQTIGKAANVQLVLLPWVQKVSNLILNLNAEVRSAETGQVIAVRSVDIRGNTDRGWLRGVRALAGRLCELDGDTLSRAGAQ